MKIWVDADACPRAIKDILCRAADRTEITVTFVANQRFRVPESSNICLVQVGQGADVADDEIAERCSAEDLVITADIPLAARIVKKGGRALDPRGTLYDSNNIGQILDMRNFMDELRGSGVETGGLDKFGAKDRLTFANELDKILTAHQNA